MLCLRYINRKRLNSPCQSFIGIYFLGLFMTKIVQGREITKVICFCVCSYYLCRYEYRIRFGRGKSKMQFPFASALTFHYLCNMRE